MMVGTRRARRAASGGHPSPSRRSTIDRYVRVGSHHRRDQLSVARRAGRLSAAMASSAGTGAASRSIVTMVLTTASAASGCSAAHVARRSRRATTLSAARPPVRMRASPPSTTPHPVAPARVSQASEAAGRVSSTCAAPMQRYANAAVHSQSVAW
jgi:hypothetical protein